jgi:hypothetical protein
LADRFFIPLERPARGTLATQALEYLPNMAAMVLDAELALD